MLKKNNQKLCLIEQILWWKNDIRMNYDDMTYSVQNRVSDQGKYKCLAKNKFGNISREFIVTANGQ